MELGMIKSIVESNLTSLHGSITSLDFDRIEDSTDGYKIEGSFRVTYGMQEYSFSMTMDQQGKVKLYQKKKTMTDQYGRNIIS